jgi:thymidylate synthase
MISHDIPQPLPGAVAPTADQAWKNLLRTLLIVGRQCSPRGKGTLEVLHHVSLSVDLNHPVVTSPRRKLNYRFMAAEALWISDGRDDLEALTRVNPHMVQFSDDGMVLAGAYGPRIRPQVGYVVTRLLEERDTRQAALTIWTPNPKPSKDIPCTIAMVFSIRENRLYQQAFMRSSDAWLGIPYDVFSFAFLGIEIACLYNARAEAYGQPPVGLGHLTITATSSHLYEEHWVLAGQVIKDQAEDVPPTVDPVMVARGSFTVIMSRVAECADRERGAEPRYPL